MLGRYDELEDLISDDCVLLFDMDDSLIDTSRANLLAYLKAIRDVTGCRIESKYRPPDKRFTRMSLHQISPKLSTSDIEAIITIKESTYIDFLKHTNTDSELLCILKKYHNTHKTAIVTNCDELRATQTIKYHKLHSFLSALFCRDTNDSNESKYKKALNYFKVKPENAIVFDDDTIELCKAMNIGIPQHNIFHTKKDV